MPVVANMLNQPTLIVAGRSANSGNRCMRLKPFRSTNTSNSWLGDQLRQRRVVERCGGMKMIGRRADGSRPAAVRFGRRNRETIRTGCGRGRLMTGQTGFIQLG